MKKFLAPICAIAALAGGPASAEVTYERAKGLISLEFLGGWRVDSDTHMAAARIRLAPGWKTYWRAPGGIGIPAQFDWSGSRNIGAIRYHWPTPKVFEEDGLTTIGYKSELVLPIEFTLRDSNKPLTVTANVEFGVCAEVCVPVSGHIDMLLDKQYVTGQQAINAALRATPHSARQAGVQNLACILSPVQDGFHIDAQFDLAKPPSSKAVAVVEYPHRGVWFDGTMTAMDGNSVRVSTTMVHFGDQPLVLDRSKLRLTLLDRGQATDIQGCPKG